MAEQDEVEAPDPIEEAKRAGKERFKDPFYFSLLVSFAATNWKAIYFLLWPTGDLDASGRINWVIGNLYECWYWWLLKLFVIPIGVAVLYVGYIPKWLHPIYAEHHRATRRLQKKKDSIDEEETKIKLKVQLLQESLDTERKNVAELNQKIGVMQEQAKLDIAIASGNAAGHHVEYLRTDKALKQSIDRVRKGQPPINQDVHQFFLKSGYMVPDNGRWKLTDAGLQFSNIFP